MKLMMSVQVLLIGLMTSPAHAVKVPKDAVAKLNVTCLAQTAAAKAAGKLELDQTPQEFCECIAGNHALEAKISETAKKAIAYLDEVTSLYKPLNESESKQARAAFPFADEADMQIVEKCRAH